MAMLHQGGCHCGRIAFTLDGEIDSVIECNCSICRQRGSLLAFFPRTALQLQTPETDLATYRFGKQRIAHHFCPICGSAPFGEAIHPKSGEPTVAVNVRCLQALDLASVKRIPYDGASL